MKKIFITLLMGLSLASCQNWLDINVNPNTPGEEDLTAGQVFPQAELSLASAYGGMLHNMGSFFVQYFDQGVGSSNFKEYSRFNVLPTNGTRVYEELYVGCLANAAVAQKLSEKDGDWGNYLAAVTVKAFAYQVLVDCFGETPYSEALQAPAINNPKYDEGKTVYDGIIAELDDALAKSEGASYSTKDLLFGDANNTTKWRQFAKALKLKLLMRQANVAGADVKDRVLALIAEGDLPTSDVKFTNWTDDTGKSNPFYEDAVRFLSKNDHMGSHAFITTMLAANDSRLNQLFEKSKNTGSHRGGVTGAEYITSTDPIDNFSRPIFKATAPVYMITSMEIDFWIAEAQYRWGSKSEAKNYYEKAIDASYAMYGLTDSKNVYDTGKAYEWKEADGLKLIALQKWIGLACVNGFESWCEVRRLGYPTFSDELGSAIVSDVTKYTINTLISPINVVVAVGNKQMLNRLFYAQGSKDKNPNAPEQKTPTTKIFWQE